MALLDGLRFTMDGVYSAFTSIGKRMANRTNDAKVEIGEIMSRQELDYLYHFTRFGRQSCDRRPLDCTRRGFRIEVDARDRDKLKNPDILDPFKAYHDRLKTVSRLRHADRLAHRYGGCGLVIIAEDGRPLDQPMGSRIRTVHAIHAIPRWDLIRNRYISDLRSPYWGDPETYLLSSSRGVTLTPDDIPGGNETNTELGKTTGGKDEPGVSNVHHSRVARFVGVPVEEEMYLEYDGWGQPVLENIYQTLTDLEITSSSVTGAMKEAQFDILKLNGLPELIAGKTDNNTGTDFEKRLDMISLSKSMVRMIALDASEDIETRSFNITALVEGYAIQQQNYAHDLGIPLTLLFGQKPAGFSTNDETGIKNYYDSVEARQEEYYEPAIRKITDAIMWSKDGPTQGRPVRYTVTFHELDRPTPKEIAETRLATAKGDQIYVGLGALSAEETRRRHTSDDFAIQLTVEDDGMSFEQAKRALAQQQGRGGARAPGMGAAPSGGGGGLQGLLAQRQDANALDGKPEKMTKGQAGYTSHSPSNAEQCQGCGWFVDTGRTAGACKLVFGAISEKGWCDLWGTRKFATDSADGTLRMDPFDGPQDPELPRSVQRLNTELRRKWVAIFNEVLEREGDESTAFKVAHAKVGEDR